MSDALTDIARDERRGEAYASYAQLLVKYAQGTASIEQVVAAAQRVDGIPRGYWGKQTSLEETVSTVAEAMKAGDKATWAAFLMGFDYYEREQFMKYSPFPEGSKLLMVDFANNWDDKIKPVFRAAFRHAGLCTEQANGGDQYVLVLTAEELRRMAKKSVWLGFRVTSWRPGEKFKKPTSPLAKSRAKYEG